MADAIDQSEASLPCTTCHLRWFRHAGACHFVPKQFLTSIMLPTEHNSLFGSTCRSERSMKHFLLEGQHIVPFEQRALELIAAHRQFLQEGYDKGQIARVLYMPAALSR